MPNMYDIAYGCMIACSALILGTGAQAAAPKTKPFATMQFNGDSVLGPRQWALKLNAGYDTAGSAYLPTPITLTPTSHFVTQFKVTLQKSTRAPQADGFAFVLQNDPNGDTALGSNGGCLGVCDISNYAAIAFKTYTNNAVGLLTGGNFTSQPMNLGKQTDVLSVTVTYDQPTTQLSFTATNSRTGEVQSNNYLIDLTTLGSNLYVGFSGASGGATSRETIWKWNFDLTN